MVHAMEAAVRSLSRALSEGYPDVEACYSLRALCYFAMARFPDALVRALGRQLE